MYLSKGQILKETDLLASQNLNLLLSPLILLMLFCSINFEQHSVSHKQQQLMLIPPHKAKSGIETYTYPCSISLL